MDKISRDYDSGIYFDELIDDAGSPRQSAKQLFSYLESLTKEELEKRKLTAEATVQEMGISFTVYTEEGNIDRAWPFDIIPRTIDAQDWRVAEAGLKQRLTALNRFIDDLYHDQNCIKDGIIPEHIIKESKNFVRNVSGFRPLLGCGPIYVAPIWCVQMMESSMFWKITYVYRLAYRICSKIGQ